MLSNLKDRRVKKVREVLDSMPTSIQTTYARILLDLHGSEEWPILERVLALVSFGARPVTVEEAAEFAILEAEMTTVNSEERIEDFNDILAMLSSLISIQDGHLILAHKSVQEFLSAGPDFGSPQSLTTSIIYEEAELYIAERCLQYLAFPESPLFEFDKYKDVKSPNAEHLSRLHAAYPFLEYAASRWTYHVRSSGISNHFATEMQSTIQLAKTPNLWKAWLLLQRADIWEARLQLARLRKFPCF